MYLIYIHSDRVISIYKKKKKEIHLCSYRLLLLKSNFVLFHIKKKKNNLSIDLLICVLNLSAK